MTFTNALRAEPRGTGVEVTLVTLGTVKSSYWDHNPGSKQHVPAGVPWLIPELSTEEAAATIIAAVENGTLHAVRPRFSRLLFALGLNS